MSELLVAGCCTCFIFWMCWEICSELQTGAGERFVAWIVSGFTISLVIGMFANSLKS